MLVKLTKNIVVKRKARKAGDIIELTGYDLSYVLTNNIGFEVKAPVKKTRRKR